MLPLSRRSLCYASSRIFSKAISSAPCHGSQATRYLTPQSVLSSSTFASYRLYATGAKKRSNSSRKEAEKNRKGVLNSALEKETTRNPLGASKAEEFLQQIGSGSREVTLADIERFKPPGHAAPDTPKYEKQYAELIEMLMRTFSLQQFRHFLSLYHLDPPKGRRTKWHYVATIVEKQWGWPSVADIQKSRKEWTEIIFKSFPLGVQQAFLMLGKDGSDLLALSSQYNIHVSFSPHPLALKVEGVKASVQKLTEHVDAIRKDISEEVFALPLKAVIDGITLQRISRNSGVFIEDLGNGVVKLHSRSSSPQSAHYAKRLMLQAAFSANDRNPMFVDFSGSGTDRGGISVSEQAAAQRAGFAFYPFYSPQPLPTAVRSPNIFRLRTVERLFGAMFDSSEALLDEGQLVTGATGSEDRLCDVLERAYEVASQHQHLTTDVSVSFGHTVITGDSLQPSLLPPLLGSQTPQAVMKFLAEHPESQFFVPSLPAKLSGSSITRPQMSHRLVYRAVSKSDLAVQPSDTRPFMSFSIALDAATTSPLKEADFGGVQFELDDGAADSNESGLPAAPSQQITMAPECQLGVALAVNLSKPSRRMDARFTFTNSSALAQNEWPTELFEYFEQLRAHLTTDGLPRPEPPLILKQDGITYGLDASFNVRQDSRSIKGADDNVSIVVENVLDLGSGQIQKLCRVCLTDSPSEKSWRALLSTVDSLNGSPGSTAPLTDVEDSESS